MSDLASLFGMSGETSVESDRSGYSALPSDIYDAIVKYVYMDTTSNGTQFIKVVLDVKGKTIESDNLWIINKETKKPYKVGNDGKPVYTYGWQVFNSLAIVASGGIDGSKLNLEKKIISKYDYAAGKDMPVEVACFTELTGKQIKVGLKELNKHSKVKMPDGTWKPSTKTKLVNTVDKYYTTDGKTAAEFVSGKDAEYGSKWLASYKNQTFEEALKEEPVEVPESGNDAMSALMNNGNSKVAQASDILFGDD